MLVVNRFRPGSDTADFTERAHAALRALAACAGYASGRLGRAADDPSLWCLVTVWASVGAYRRALGAYDVKLHATPLLTLGIEEPGAYEVLASLDPGGELVVALGDRMPAEEGRG